MRDVGGAHTTHSFIDFDFEEMLSSALRTVKFKDDSNLKKTPLIDLDTSLPTEAPTPFTFTQITVTQIQSAKQTHFFSQIFPRTSGKYSQEFVLVTPHRFI